MTLDYRSWLYEEFSLRCKKNANYSMRSFSKLLNVDSSSMSQILSGKRNVSSKKLTNFIQVLGAKPEVKNALLNFTNSRCVRNQLELHDSTDVYRQMTLDSFDLISEWYHSAILELTFVCDFKSSPRWISTKLGIQVDVVKIAIGRLKRLKLLEEKDGVLYKTEVFITNFSEGVTSASLKNYQKQILSMAMDAIENIPPQEKDITGIIMAIDEKKLPEARLLIKKFRRELSEYLENGKQTRVYQLGIQLYPVSKS